MKLLTILCFIMALTSAAKTRSNPSLLRKHIPRNLPLKTTSKKLNRERQLSFGDMFKDSGKSEKQSKLDEQIYQMKEEMKLFNRDALDLDFLNHKVDDLRVRIIKVMEAIKGKIDFGRARLMTLG